MNNVNNRVATKTTKELLIPGKLYKIYSRCKWFLNTEESGTEIKIPFDSVLLFIKIEKNPKILKVNYGKPFAVFLWKNQLVRGGCNVRIEPHLFIKRVTKEEEDLSEE